MSSDNFNVQESDIPEEKRPSREKEWVKSFVPRLNSDLTTYRSKESELVVSACQKLPYLCQIHEYEQDASNAPTISSYETDLLIKDQFPDGRWVPRVVVECKLGSVTTHDALTYSAKAATHKHVHPYLRYGILIGNHEKQALPGRLIRHGAYFDFMLSWGAAEARPEEWARFCELVGKEVEASRRLQELLTESRSTTRKKITILHRPLLVS